MQFMYAITPTQSKAARAYLEWSQEDLAKAADVSLSTVRSFENGFSPRRGSVIQIRKTLENAGVEFTDGEGVRRGDNDVKVYRGMGSCDKFFNDLIQTLKTQGGDVECVMKSQDMFIQSLGISDRDDLERLEMLDDAANIKCLVAGAPAAPFFMPSFEFRTVLPQQASPSSYCIYGNKYAHVLQEGRASFTFVVFHIITATQGYRSHFTSLWNNALPLRTQPALQDCHARVAIGA